MHLKGLSFRRLGAVLLALCMAGAVLAGCGGDDKADTGHIVEAIPEEEMAAVQQPTQAPAAEEAAAPVEEAVEEEIDDEKPPREGMVRSPFTNEWVDEALVKNRPIAMMYPINKEAQPQYGLNKVEVFYEIMEEGSMSRQMGIISDWQNLDRIGNIRSIRDYFVYAALEYDPIVVHFGGPIVYVKDILTRSDVDNLNGVGGEMGGAYNAFYRIPAGSTSEHTAYTDGSHLQSAISSAGFQKEHRSQYWEGESHFKFASKSNPNTLEQYDRAVNATEIDMTGSYPVTKSALTYNENDHLYYKRLYGGAQVDGATGEQMAFANILIEKAYYIKRDNNGYLSFQMHDTTRDGYFITRGKMIHVTWKKEGDYLATRFYDDNGEEIKVNTGKTMIFVIRDGTDSFTVNGTKYD
ncbi:MAG: DUF3048 domain-containing protein [Lachnospiraceae bacterium]|nr:DUF3048 domain-containing protein [Lachnospiraceae bacterium]